MPTMQDNSGDADRLRRALAQRTGLQRMQIDLDLLQELPYILRKAGFKVNCALLAGRENCLLCSVQNQSASARFLGLAVDLGTTTYTLRLLDLVQNTILAEKCFANPQAEYGPDILTRIHFASEPKKSSLLQKTLMQGLNKSLQELCSSLDLDPLHIVGIALSGNTAMTHFLLNLPTHWMIREPYIPALNRPEPLRATELGLQVHPGAGLFCFPNAGSYFGGDLYAGILYSGLHKKHEISILVDVGTNAEVVLGNQDWLIACAGAAGPALEGGVSEIGMQAGPGVIDSVSIDPGNLEFQLQTIDGLPPTGICGSGLIDLAAQLFQAGLLDFRGKFLPEKLPQRFVRQADTLQLKLVGKEHTGSGQDLLLSQAELDSLIRSKAAMYTILETLASSVGLTLQDVETFYVAGAFGNLINPVSAITIGMLPDLPLERYQPLGNSSLEGSTLLLRKPQTLQDLIQIENKITYLELNVNQDFMNRFSAAKFLPHTEKSLFPSVPQAL